MNTTSTSDVFLKRLRLFILLVVVFSLFWFGDSIWFLLMSYESVLRYTFFFMALLVLAYFIFFRRESDTQVIFAILSFVEKLFLQHDEKPSNGDRSDVADVATQKSKSIVQKRAVSGYTKRMIASKQEWKCSHCSKMLQASFEVDHILALSDGGTNQEDNLVALCRNCHGEKTFLERIKKNAT